MRAQTTGTEPTILDTIVAQKRIEVARMQDEVCDVRALRGLMQARGERRDFIAALRQPRLGKVSLIAEVKKASPSAGVICADFDPVRIARAYESAGASCLSVLTDERFFQGSLDFLAAIRREVKLPLLRKDFMIDPRQIAEAIRAGADAILLIVAILEDARLREMHELAVGAGLAALVEVHDEAELDRALASGARLIGVNNRDLKSFKVDLSVTERLAHRVAQLGKSGEILLVGESGIHTRADVVRLETAGTEAILVGESIVKSPDIGAKIRELLIG